MAQDRTLLQLSIFYHTNFKLSTEAPADLRITTSWFWNEHFQEARAELRRIGLAHVPFRLRAQKPMPVQFAIPHQWTSVLASANEGQAEPFVLLDTDTVVQCTAKEFLQRWQAFASPLVIGTEMFWKPRPDYHNDPWPFTPSMLRYPNSGVVMGTRESFELIRDIQRLSFPQFPCCPRVVRGVATSWCYVEAQHCMQSALQNGTFDPLTKAFVPSVDYKLDHNASLFLSLHGMAMDDLEQLPDGRFLSRRTGQVPCVLHTNGAGSRSSILAELARRAPSSSYIPLRDMLRSTANRSTTASRTAQLEPSKRVVSSTASVLCLNESASLGSQIGCDRSVAQAHEVEVEINKLEMKIAAANRIGDVELVAKLKQRLVDL
mmetsp:Transcript_13458/g.34490  ORF Transcript_13458/g.34490 Transcript_13458/m.34490 type:complete len:376 (-) Transcript_13458:38-1165(-)